MMNGRKLSFDKVTVQESVESSESKPVSLSVIKSIKTNLVFLTKPGEQFIHAFTEPTIKEQKVFVGTVSGKITEAP